MSKAKLILKLQPGELIYREGEAGLLERFQEGSWAFFHLPTVGREAEIAIVLESWQRSLESEGQAVLVTGEPGISYVRPRSATVV